MDASIPAPPQRSPPCERAFTAALVGQMPALRSYARRLTRGRSEWDDLVQDTLLRCWAARESFTLGSNLVAWTRTVMRNCFFTDKRRARRQVDLTTEAISDMLSVAENQSDVVHLRDAAWALGELAPTQRDVITLLADGTTVRESALQLGITEATLKSRASRGRHRLRLLVEDRATPRLQRRQTITQSRLYPVAKPRKQRDWTGVIIG